MEFKMEFLTSSYLFIFLLVKKLWALDKDLDKYFCHLIAYNEMATLY